MLKFIVSVLLIALFGFLAGLYLPWWSIAIAAFLVSALIPQLPFKSFLSGFTGIFLLWMGLAWWIDSMNEQVLSQRIAQLLPLGGNSILLILVTALIGALVGGFAALTASFLRKRKRRTLHPL